MIMAATAMAEETVTKEIMVFPVILSLMTVNRSIFLTTIFHSKNIGVFGMTKKKKPNKAQREQIKREKADEYNAAFSHGFAVGERYGYEKALKDRGLQNE